MFLTNFRIAMAALKSAKVRTALTMLGIIIGVASVTLIMALGEGIKREVTQEVDKFGSELIEVRPGKVERDGSGTIVNANFMAAFSQSTLTEKDVDAIKQTPGVAAAAPFMLVTGGVERDGKQIDNPMTIATTPDLPVVLNQKVATGEFFHSSMNKEVVVVGRNVANKLFGVDNQLGGKIKIRGTDFTVIGIMEDRGDAATFGGAAPGLNDFLYIPFEAGKDFYQGVSLAQEINVKLQDGSDADAVIANLQANILANHNGQEDFSIIKQEEALAITSSVIHLVTSFTAAIASISLLVGGVGIMNIMLVSVTERTREIGIRKSIGATNGQILSQFLIEAVVISIVGGLLGVGLAALGGVLLYFKADVTPVLTPNILLLAGGVSMAVGVIFGIAPALKAAHKDPIEALRHE